MPAPKGHPPYNKNGEGGRPVRYTEDYENQLAKALEEWTREKDNMFIERFCFENDLPESKIAELNKNERFSKAYEKLKSKQKMMLFEGGLKRKFAHPMCALILSHNHGIVAKTEQKVTGDALNPLSFVVSNVDGSTKDLVNG